MTPEEELREEWIARQLADLPPLTDAQVQTVARLLLAAGDSPGRLARAEDS